jgi:putative nucleotidyltransferase with HDIG domain
MKPLEKIFSQTQVLPTIPKVVHELIQSLNNEDADIGKLARSVSQDQVISARVLRLANSSYYGSSRKVASIDDAVTLVGLNQLRILVIACGMAGSFVKVPGVDLGQFWKHSLLTAMLARILAKDLGGANPEVAFTGGLMHGIGILLIHNAFPDLASQVSAAARDGIVATRVAAERELLETDHCEVGMELAKRWNFADEIKNAIHFYHNPLLDGADSYAMMTFIASVIAQMLVKPEQIEVLRTKMSHELSQAVLQRIGSFEERLEKYGYLTEAANAVL